jgi:IstB-like ATP binding protein
VRLGRIPLLMIDEVGYIPFDPDAAALFFGLVSSRYERASLIVTSNKTFSAWAEIFGDAVAVALLRRCMTRSSSHAARPPRIMQPEPHSAKCRGWCGGRTAHYVVEGHPDQRNLPLWAEAEAWGQPRAGPLGRTRAGSMCSTGHAL